MTGSWIARVCVQRLFLALSTVKGHNLKIFEKLRMHPSNSMAVSAILPSNTSNGPGSMDSM